MIQVLDAFHVQCVAYRCNLAIKHYYPPLLLLLLPLPLLLSLVIAVVNCKLRHITSCFFPFVHLSSMSSCQWQWIKENFCLQHFYGKVPISYFIPLGQWGVQQMANDGKLQTICWIIKMQPLHQSYWWLQAFYIITHISICVALHAN